MPARPQDQDIRMPYCRCPSEFCRAYFDVSMPSWYFLEKVLRHEGAFISAVFLIFLESGDQNARCSKLEQHESNQLHQKVHVNWRRMPCPLIDKPDLDFSICQNTYQILLCKTCVALSFALLLLSFVLFSLSPFISPFLLIMPEFIFVKDKFGMRKSKFRMWTIYSCRTN
jgi:hypothetical protein